MTSGVYQHKKGYKRPKEFGEKLVILFKGRKVSDEAKRKMSLAKIGKKRLPHSEETKRKIGIANSITQSGKPKPWKVGELNHFWKGGVTSVNEAIRKSLKYKLWRKEVFERDNYTCQICGTRGGTLNADHIKPFFLFSKIRIDVNNGRTLCRQCHLTTETFGNRLKFNRLYKNKICIQ